MKKSTFNQKVWATVLTATLLICPGPMTPSARAQSCATCLIETKSSEASLRKCGYAECQASVPPKYYLQKTVAETDHYFSTVTTNGNTTSLTANYNPNCVYTLDRTQAHPPTGHSPSECILWVAPESTSGTGTADYTPSPDPSGLTCSTTQNSDCSWANQTCANNAAGTFSGYGTTRTQCDSTTT